jgi:hypothetical protein
MTRESFASVVCRFLSVLYGLGSILFAARALVSGAALSLPHSIDPSLAIGPSWLAAACLLQAIVVCSFLIAVAETTQDSRETFTQPKPPRDFSAPFVESAKQAVA